MKRLFQILTISLFLLLDGFLLHGQIPRMIPYTQDESITAICKDDEGRICYSSLKGLYSYDGTETSEILSGINVLDFFPCEGGGFWIAAPDFIGHIPGNGSLVRHTPQVYGDNKRILDLDEGSLLFTNDDGVYVIDKGSGEILSSFAFTFSGTASLLKDSREGRIWIAAGGTLMVFDKSLSLLRRIESASGRTINTMVSDKDGNVLLGTTSGIICVSAGDYALRELRSFSGKDILSMSSLPEGGTACLVEGTGIAFLDSDRSETIFATDVQLTPTSRMFALDSGHIWFSWGRYGLYFLPVPARQGPPRLHNLAMAMDGRKVEGLDEDSEGRIWILSEGKLSCYDKASSSIREVTIPGVLSGQEIKAITVSSDDRLWAASGEYLAGYRIAGASLTPEKSYHCEGNLVNRIFEAPGGEIFFQFYNQQYKYSEQTAFVKLDSSRPYILASFPEEKFIIKTSGNRISFDKGDLHIDNYPLLGQGRNISAATLSSDGSIWCLCSDWRILRLHDDMSFEEYTLPGWRRDNEEISDFVFYSIEEDTLGNIWVGSAYGLVKTVPGKEDYFEIYNSARKYDYYNTSLRDSEGNLYFAYSNGLTIFSPDSENTLISNKDVPLMIDDIQVNNVSLDRGAPSENVFPYNHNNFIFKCTDINYDDLRIRYKYILEGYDKDWDYLSGRYVRYSDLPAGEYTFKVKSEGSDEKEQEFSFKIKQKPWLGTWAVLGYILLGALILTAIATYLVHRRRQRILAEERKVKEQLDKAKMELFANLSHELRTPLTLISAPLKDLERSESLNDEDHKKIEVMGRNVKELLDVTNQLLRYDKIENDPLHLRRHDILREMTLCADAFSGWAKERGIDLRILSSERIVFNYDSVKISRVLSNLLSNAIKYSYDNGKVELRAGIVRKEDIQGIYGLLSSDDPFIEISVSDNGRGITFDKRESIFERHVREESISGEIPGFGIGLNYVRQLVHEHGGRIAAQANSPVGSVFRFILPVGEGGYEILPSSVEEIPSSESPSRENSIRDAGKDLEGLSLLIVEDHDQMRKYVEGIFSPHAGKVHSCIDARSALEYMKNEYVDIVISDVMMPGMDGYHLCGAIKKDPVLSSVSVVLLTAKNDTESRIYGLNIGADAYVGKPFVSDYILAVVESVARARSRRRDILLRSTSETVSEDLSQDSLMNETDRAFLDKLYSLLDERIQEEEINVNALLKDLGMSRTGLYLKVKNLTGKSPIQYINEYRMNKALILLRCGKYSIKEIAYMVGYQTRQSFTARFKSTFGYAPTEFNLQKENE